MEERRSFQLKARGVGLSAASVYYATVIYLVLQWLLALLLLPLTYFFPALEKHAWIFALPCVVVLAILVANGLASFFTVSLDETGVCLYWFRIRIRQIPADRLRLFCAVGNVKEDVLCLTSRCIADMALREEKKLLHSSFTKDEVFFIKKKPNWQEVLARRYLNGLRRSLWGIFKDREVIFLEMQPDLQQLIGALYPQLPYRNYTEVRSACPRYEPSKNAVFSFSVYTERCYADIQEDGIHISTKKKPVFQIAARHIKAVVRVDVFRPYWRYYPHHIPLLLVSSLSVDELAANAPQQRYGEHTAAFPSCRTLRAYACAARTALRWKIKDQDFCLLPCTRTNMTLLRAHYPDAEWIDLSDGWLSDKNPPA